MIRVGYLGLGSNLGDRAAELRGAIAGLKRCGVRVLALSSGYETEPVGEIRDQPDFLNAAVKIETDLGPEALLDLCKAVEADAGRDFNAPRHSPRPVDVDLLLLGDLEIETKRLSLPHPQARHRRFVLVPLLELDPELTLPEGLRLADALAGLPAGERVEPWGPIGADRYRVDAG